MRKFALHALASIGVIVLTIAISLWAWFSFGYEMWLGVGCNNLGYKAVEHYDGRNDKEGFSSIPYAPNRNPLPLHVDDEGRSEREKIVSGIKAFSVYERCNTWKYNQESVAVVRFKLAENQSFALVDGFPVEESPYQHWGPYMACARWRLDKGIPLNENDYIRENKHKANPAKNWWLPSPVVGGGAIEIIRSMGINWIDVASMNESSFLGIWHFGWLFRIDGEYVYVRVGGP